MQTSKIVGSWTAATDGTVYDVAEIEATEIEVGDKILSGMGYCVVSEVEPLKVNRFGVPTVHVFTQSHWDRFFTGSVRKLVERTPR